MILITGANGKLGRALMDALAKTGTVRGAARTMPERLAQGMQGVAVGALQGDMDWRPALDGVDTIIHCAALTWVDSTSGDRTQFRIVNVDATRTLAEQAAEAGAKRLVYISSLTVNGKHSGECPFRHDDVPNPASEYSCSKWQAEQVLREIERRTGLEVVVIRPPRIIWAELSGNLALMAKLIAKGIPLPFGMLTKNARDNVSAENLVQAILRAASVPAAAGKTLLVSDNDPLSTSELTKRLGAKVGRPPRLLPVPEALLRLTLKLAPKQLLGKLDSDEMLAELTRNLQVDSSHTHEVLNWKPERA